MGFKAIDQANYLRTVSRLQWALVIALFVLSLGFSELYHLLWVDVEGLWLNAAAVLTALLLLSGVVYCVRHQPWMADIRYVLTLKSELNRIYRASRKLEAALAKDDPDAICIRYFSLHGSFYLYQLENNTLTLDELQEQIVQLDQQIERLGLTISAADYHSDLLAKL